MMRREIWNISSPRKSEFGKLLTSSNQGLINAATRWRTCHTLVIDEMSMVPRGFFKLLEYVARAIRGNSRPFGGIQLICVGDFLRLPPVKARSVLECPVFERCIDVKWKLTQLHRQMTDSQYGQTMQRLRVGALNDEDMRLLVERSKVEIDVDKEPIFPTHIYPTKKEVSGLNEKKLAALQTESQTFTAKSWTSPGYEEYAKFDACLAPKELILKVGAQVILLRNLSTVLVNGSRGVVQKFGSLRHVVGEERMQVCEHPNPSETKWPIVAFENGLRLLLSQEVWSHELWDEKLQTQKVVATYSQVPLDLAWALTIHKSQGMSLEKMVANLNAARFEGQSYVALSRLKTRSGLYLKGFDARNVMVNKEALKYMSSITNDDGVTPKIEAAVPKAVSALPCKYGSECYRKNPTHLSEFYHPPK